MLVSFLAYSLLARHFLHDLNADMDRKYKRNISLSLFLGRILVHEYLEV